MKKGRIISAVSLIVLSLLITGCQSVDWKTVSEIALKVGEVGVMSAESISKAAEDFTPENKYYIGRSVAASLLAYYTPADTPEMNRYLTAMANSIAALDVSHTEPFRGYFVAVLDSNEINAFATSGGHIFVTKGFIKSIKNEDQLAAVIAHEMSHIQLEHGVNAIRTSRVYDAGLNVLKNSVEIFSDKRTKGDDVDRIVGYFGNVMGVELDTLINSGYGQIAEFEADENAVELLMLSGYNPAEMYEMLNMIKDPSSSYQSAFGKTHPDPQTRIDELQKKFRNLPVQYTSSARTTRFQQQLQRMQ